MKQTKDDPQIIKSCYTHIGGKFGNALTVRFEELGWIRRDPQSKNYLITPRGSKEFRKLGIDTTNL